MAFAQGHIRNAFRHRRHDCGVSRSEDELESPQGPRHVEIGDCDDKPNDYICSRVMRAALTETGVERPEEVTAVMRE
ncbi:hypothetical protein VCV18_009657 [Metarhizium anisopliae]